MRPSALLSSLRLRLRSLFRRSQSDAQFEDEMAFHLDMEAQANIARGMSAVDARRAAIIAFGGRERIREDRQDASGVRLLQDGTADVRYALRWLRRSPAFTASVLLTLALGVGSTSAIFGIVNGVLLKPLPYPHPESLVAVWSRLGSDANPGTSSPPDFREYRDQSASFSEIGAWWETAANLLVDGEPQRMEVARVSASVLPMLGTRYAAGRGFLPEEEVAGNSRVVILTHATWMSHFGGRPDIVGSPILVDSEPHVVVGVTAPSFRFLNPRLQVFRPVALAAEDNLNTRGNYFVSIVARLRPGVTASGAEADLERVVERIRADHGDVSVRGAFVVPLHKQMVGSARSALLLLLAASGLLLAIACANVAGLLLARATAREREFTVRAGLGATRSRIVRQLVTEAMLLGAAGAVLGLIMATGAIRGLKAMNVSGVPRLNEAALDATVFAGALAVSLLAGVACGLWPALRLTRRGHDSLRAGGRTSSGTEHRRVRRVLVGAQVAFAMMLLIGSGLLVRSFTAMQRADPGFSVENIVTAALPVDAGYDDAPERLHAFADQVLDRIRGREGIEAAALTSGLSLRGGEWGKLVTLGDRPLPTTGDAIPGVGYRLVSPGYFEAMGVRRVSGRTFEQTDGALTQQVAIVNVTFAQRFWPQGDPLGKVIWMGPPEEMMGPRRPEGFRFPRLTIVGVVADERFSAVDQAPQAEVYQLYSQTTETPSTLFLVVRSRAGTAAVVSHMRASVREADPVMPVAQVATMGELVRESGGRRRVGTILVSAFAALALILAVVGVYGIAAQFVAQRSRELGIRMAMGADRRRLMGLVLREGGTTAAVGALVGLAGAVAGSRFVKDVLYGVQPTDPGTYAAIVAVLVLAILAAVAVPARRAARIPPASVLRGE